MAGKTKHVVVSLLNGMLLGLNCLIAPGSLCLLSPSVEVPARDMNWKLPKSS